MRRMGRPRKTGNRDLPPNLYAHGGGWRYVHPVTGKPSSWAAVPRDRAVESAKKLNALLIPASQDLVAQVMGEGKTVKDAIALFRSDELPHLDYADKTLTEVETKLAKIEHVASARALASYDVREAALLLRAITESPRNRQQFRTLLVAIFAGALEEGWVEFNPFRETKKPKYKKQRARLTVEGYAAIYHQAHTWGWRWLMNAMDLTLEALFRGGDVTALQFAEIRDNRIHVVPQKTADSTGVRLRIEMWPSLAAIVARCRDNVASPHLVHRLPEKARPMGQRAKKRTHHTQVLREQLTRAFEDARDATGYFAGEKNPPTYHEIRSLGGDLHRQAGRSEEWIQALYAHSTRDPRARLCRSHRPPLARAATGDGLPNHLHPRQLLQPERPRHPRRRAAPAALHPPGA